MSKKALRDLSTEVCYRKDADYIVQMLWSPRSWLHLNPHHAVLIIFPFKNLPRRTLRHKIYRCVTTVYQYNNYKKTETRYFPYIYICYHVENVDV
jgi:hypothetical protein